MGHIISQEESVHQVQESQELCVQEFDNEKHSLSSEVLALYEIPHLAWPSWLPQLSTGTITA